MTGLHRPRTAASRRASSLVLMGCFAILSLSCASAQLGAMAAPDLGHLRQTPVPGNAALRIDLARFLRRHGSDIAGRPFRILRHAEGQFRIDKRISADLYGLA